MKPGLYETMLILDPTLGEADLGAAMARITKILTASEGSRIVREEKWGNRDLAYPIKKHQKGLYVLITHELSSDEVGSLRPDLRLVGGVLRFMTVTASRKPGAEKTKPLSSPASTGKPKAEEPGATPEAV